MESLILVDVGPPLDEELGQRFWSAMESRRSPEDEGGGGRIRASAEFKSGEPAALERFMKNLYGPFFRDPGTPEHPIGDSPPSPPPTCWNTRSG